MMDPGSWPLDSHPNIFANPIPSPPRCGVAFVDTLQGMTQGKDAGTHEFQEIPQGVFFLMSKITIRNHYEITRILKRASQ